VNILCINVDRGDSSAALIVNGEVVGAAEEEHFRRIKHWAGFPSESKLSIKVLKCWLSKK
jgi:carbamoyltransferase